MQHAIGINAAFKTREQAAYEAIRAAIVDGRLPQSAQLNVSRLADEIGVSRLTVANAVKRLSGEGFVELRPHRESAVMALNTDRIREIYMMRAELEALATREAVLHLTVADLDDLQALNDAIGAIYDAPVLDVRALRAADLTFHARLRAISRMELLSQTLLNLADRCEGYRARLLDARFRVLPSPDRHMRILAALAARDADLAGAAMHEHVTSGMVALLEQIEAGEDEEIVTRE